MTNIFGGEQEILILFVLPIKLISGYQKKHSLQLFLRASNGTDQWIDMNITEI